MNLKIGGLAAGNSQHPNINISIVDLLGGKQEHLQCRGHHGALRD
jgi:hypothetical protein